MYGGYVPKLTAERIEELRRWHEDASAELHRLGAHDVEYLGLRLHVPEHVFPPTPTSDLLGREVMANVRPGQRVLDMGCGAGANAILAAQITDDVVAVDVNPYAVAAKAANAERNGVAARVRCFESDVFSGLDGDFDVIVIDPPFRWFRPGTCSSEPLPTRTTRPSAGSSRRLLIDYVWPDLCCCSSVPVATWPTSTNSSATPA